MSEPAGLRVEAEGVARPPFRILGEVGDLQHAVDRFAGPQVDADAAHFGAEGFERVEPPI